MREVIFIFCCIHHCFELRYIFFFRQADKSFKGNGNGSRKLGKKERDDVRELDLKKNSDKGDSGGKRKLGKNGDKNYGNDSGIVKLVIRRTAIVTP